MKGKQITERKYTVNVLSVKSVRSPYASRYVVLFYFTLFFFRLLLDFLRSCCVCTLDFPLYSLHTVSVALHSLSCGCIRHFFVSVVNTLQSCCLDDYTSLFTITKRTHMHTQPHTHYFAGSYVKSVWHA